MELSVLSVITLMERLPLPPWEGISPCEDIEKAYKEFSEQVEIGLNDGLASRYPNRPRLFHSRINGATSQERSAFDAREDFSLTSLVYNDGDGSSDLMSCLTSQVFPEFPERRSLDTDHAPGGCTTMEPADVIAFALARDEGPLSPVAGRSHQRREFSFPESFCLDQFATTSRARAQNTNVAEGKILRETGFGPAVPNNEDVMKGTLPSLHHYESAANPSAGVERRSAIDRSAAKLEGGVAHIEAELKSIGAGAKQSREESQDLSLAKQAQGNMHDGVWA